MEKNIIRLTENQLKHIISETAKKLLETKYNYKAVREPKIKL